MRNAAIARWSRAVRCSRFLGVVAGVLAILMAAAAACGGDSVQSEPTTVPQPSVASAGANGDGAAAPDDAASGSMLAPSFQLPNALGNTVSLASYAGEKNVVLVFYRGFW